MSKVFVAGGHGFLGSHLVKRMGALREAEKGQYNYERFEHCVKALRDLCPDVVINAAGRTAGIQASKASPATFFMTNLRSGSTLMEAALGHGVKKFVQIGTVCSYPKEGVYPMGERDFWNGYPEESNAAYGMAKKILVVQAQAYAKQHDFNVISPILANLYGPGDDYTSQSHVIPAMIMKFLDAMENGANTVCLWGTGECTRDFLFVEDAAEAINLLTNDYDHPEIINVASGSEIRIRDLAQSVAAGCGYTGDIRWDSSKPNGQKRRVFDTSRIERLGWRARTTLKRGVEKSIADCKEYRKNAVAA